MATAGCTPVAESTAPGTADLLADYGCTRDDTAFSDIVVEDTAIPTVHRISWSARDGDAARLVFAVDADLVIETNPGVVADGREAVVVRGVPASSSVHYRVVSEAGLCSTEATYETGALRADLPQLDFEGTGDSGLGYVAIPFVGEFGDDAAILTVVDHRGRYVWASSPLGQPASGDRNAVPVRMEVSETGSSFFISYLSESVDTDGVIAEIDWTGQVLSQTLLTGLHNDFSPAPGGGFFWLGWDIRELDGDDGQTHKVLGDTVNRTMADGTTVELWNGFDYFWPDLSVAGDTGYYAADLEVEDWLHANGMSYDPVRDEVLVSLGNKETVVGIDAVTGAQHWSLGTDTASISADVDTPVLNPHSVYAAADDQLIVFNRMEIPGGCSRADTFRVDHAQGSATLQGAYAGDGCLSIYYLGQARPTDDGDTLVVWTTAGRADVVDEGGGLLWSVTARLGAGMAFSDQRTTLYR